MAQELDDDEVRDALREIDDNEDIEVSGWEAEFIDSIVFKNGHVPLSESQYDKCLEIIERYE